MKDCNDVHWSYHEGKDGPENWKNLCDGFAACGGQSQSPINIITNETTKGDNLTALKLHYDSSKVDIAKNGTAIQFNTSGNNTITIGDKKYKLLQFHYHAKSEHTINGKHFPIEVHIVNKYSDSDYAILGIMFQEGEDNELFTEFLSHFPVHISEYVSERTIDVKKLLPPDLSYYYYKGSLTTPPCSEVVHWYILKTPRTASMEQIGKFRKILNNNFRPVMPLNDRKVLSFEE